MDYHYFDTKRWVWLNYPKTLLLLLFHYSRPHYPWTRWMTVWSGSASGRGRAGEWNFQFCGIKLWNNCQVEHISECYRILLTNFQPEHNAQHSFLCRILSGDGRTRGDGGSGNKFPCCATCFLHPCFYAAAAAAPPGWLARNSFVVGRRRWRGGELSKPAILQTLHSRI